MIPASSFGQGQPGAQNEDTELHPLSVKEEMIRDRFHRFQDRIFNLRQELLEREPQNAARLARALERAGELGLSDELNEVMELLRDPAALSEAHDRQGKWIADAENLLNILLERDGKDDEREREIKGLEAIREELGEILREEKALRDAAAQAAQAGRMLQQLEQAAQRLDAMIQRQDALSKGTQEAKSADQLGEKSEEQEDLARDASELAEDLNRMGELKPNESADSAAQEKARAAAKSAASSTQKGSESMSQAAQKMGGDQKAEAQEDQTDAEKQLREAKAELEEAIKQLKEESNTDPVAEQQQQTAERTQSLSEQMRAQGAQQGQSSGQQSGKTTPGQQNVQQAQGHMQDAGGQLDQQKPEDATKSQDQAIEKLEEAKRELEQALQQLRQQERAEVLRDLENRIRQMLTQQRSINESTSEFAALNKPEFDRGEQLALADLSARQEKLSDRASTCVHILEEEGTTVAFPHVMLQVATDMQTVAGRLGQFQVGDLTRQIESEIVLALEQLLEAIQKMQQANEQAGAGGGGGGGGGNQPLLPDSAELKLLRSSQLRVNTRTQTIQAARTEGSESEASASQALIEASRRQRECAEIARQIRDRLQPQ